MAAPKPLACIEPRLARFVQQQPENSLANYFYAMAIWKRQQQPMDQAGLAAGGNSAHESSGDRPEMRRRLPAAWDTLFFPTSI